MPLKLALGRLTALDIYGHPINVNHRGKAVYQTWLGTIFTLMTYALIMVNAVELITKFRTKSDQIETYQMIKDLYDDKNVTFAYQPTEIMFASFVLLDSDAD